MILSLLVLISFVFYVLDWKIFKPARVRALGKEGAKKRPWWLEWTAGFFWVFLVVFTVRGFIVEPFRIPSGSMLPTLEKGDMIIVNKMAYNWRVPVLDKVFVRFSSPKKGDVAVFRYPMDPTKDYIKRVVATPGDTIAYINRELFINGEKMSQTYVAPYLNIKQQSSGEPMVFETRNGEKPHQILLSNYQGRVMKPYQPFSQDQCQFDQVNFKCTVPEGYYFMMGDNRDNSSDSRIWGFVQEDAIIGKAFFIWFNFHLNLDRIGSIQ